MDTLRPISTSKAECQDCYKCLRECPIKAIRICDGNAEVVPDLCIHCGHCVQVCPVGAKHGRQDVERARRLLALKQRVYVSLAPSYVTEFADWPRAELIQALRRLGFAGVSETALGAEEVSATLAEQINEATRDELYLSSACPAVVEYLQKYRPELAASMTKIVSPLLAHCRILRQHYGPEIGIVFVGPCLGKKAEADANPELLDVAITFVELRQWLTSRSFQPGVLEARADDVFVPDAAADGVLYPVDGGMIAGLERHGVKRNVRMMTFSGMKAIQEALSQTESIMAGGPVFLELLACSGGCVNGAGVSHAGGTLGKRLQILDQAEAGAPARARRGLPLELQWVMEPIGACTYGEETLREALREVGKFVRADELNCGGCGYDSCREFAAAMLDGKAERNMCVSYMRKLATKKANALIRTMPSGVIIVDENLRVVESNLRFAELMGAEVQMVYEAKPGLEGASLSKLVPFSGLFAQVLRSGQEKLEKDLRLTSAILHVTIFTIEAHRLVGAVMQDITQPAVQKERIIKQAQDVITRNLNTVQQIAYLLGENAAESEVILNSIIESFTPEQIGRGEDA